MIKVVSSLMQMLNENTGPFKPSGEEKLPCLKPDLRSPRLQAKQISSLTSLCLCGQFLTLQRIMLTGHEDVYRANKDPVLPLVS